MDHTLRRETPLDWLMMIGLSLFGVVFVIWRYGRLTGIHAALLFIHAFVLIISVNVLLAYKAVTTFPGLEVANSYVASQTFDVDRAAQVALGWTVAAHTENGELIVAITDSQNRPVQAQTMAGTFGRATEVRDDQTPAFVFDGHVYRAPVAIAPGKWDFWIDAVGPNGAAFRQRLNVRVRG